jgi:hypothetical protein
MGRVSDDPACLFWVTFLTASNVARPSKGLEALFQEESGEHYVSKHLQVCEDREDEDQPCQWQIENPSHALFRAWNDAAILNYSDSNQAPSKRQ